MLERLSRRDRDVEGLGRAAVRDPRGGCPPAPPPPRLGGAAQKGKLVVGGPAFGSRASSSLRRLWGGRVVTGRCRRLFCGSGLLGGGPVGPPPGGGGGPPPFAR